MVARQDRSWLYSKVAGPPSRKPHEQTWAAAILAVAGQSLPVGG